MYTKDKSNRITLRLNDAQFAFVKYNADICEALGVTVPDDYVAIEAE